MNDRLKFRCWDDVHREMLDLQEQDVNPYNISDIPQNNIMQCTGLKDNTLNYYAGQALDETNRYRKALGEIQLLVGKIISNDDQPACVMDIECPLNGGVGFDNHCNENCPLISAKQIFDVINKAKGEE